MDRSAYKDHLEITYDRILDKMVPILGIPYKIEKLEMIIRPMIIYGGVTQENGKLRYLYLRDITESHFGTLEELAKIEFTLAHEVGHQIHFEVNPQQRLITFEEDDKVLKFKKRTTTNKRIYIFNEFIAEYFALLSSDVIEGLNSTLNRIGNSEPKKEVLREYNQLLNIESRINFLIRLMEIEYCGDIPFYILKKNI